MTRKQFGSVPWTHLYTEQKPGIGLFHISPLTRALGSAHYEQVILFDLQAVSTQRVKCFIGWVERTTAAATQMKVSRGLKRFLRYLRVEMQKKIKTHLNKQ